MGFTQQPHSQVLIDLPTVELHQVQNGQQDLLCAGGLQVLQLQSEAGQSMVAQVGNARWTLRKGLPCLQVTACVYTFIVDGLPEGSYYILVVQPRTPDCVLEALEGVLCSCTTFHVSTDNGYYTVSQPAEAGDREELVATAPPQQQPGNGALVPSVAHSSTTDKVVSGIHQRAQSLRVGIVKAAHMASSGIEKGTEYIVQHTKPRTNPVKISAETQERIRKVGAAAATAGKVAGTAAVIAADVTAGIACALADRVAKSDMAHKMAKSEFATSNRSALKSAQKVGGATVTAACHLLEAMEVAGRIVLSSTGAATTTIVEHKYGSEAGLAAKGSTEAAGSMLGAALAMRKLGTRALVKATAKNVGTELLHRPKWGPSSSMPARSVAAADGAADGSLAGQLLSDERVLQAVASAGPAVASAAAKSGLLNDGRVVGALAGQFIGSSRPAHG